MLATVRTASALRATSKIAAASSLRAVSTFHQNPQIYIHPGKEPSTSVLSFFEDPSKQVIGTVMASITSSKIPPDAFKQDTNFLPFLHKLIAENVSDDFTYIMESKAYANQHMPIYDLRKPPEYQRIPEVEDTFGYVAVDDKGEVKKGSYQENGFYRVVTADGEILKLSDHLLEKLREG